MALPCTQQTLEHKKFVECPDGSGNPAVRTKICQDSGETIKVEFDEAGTPLNIYDEANSVAGGATITVITYVVPVSKEFRLLRIEFSGTNRGEYIVDINSSTEAKKRTYFTDYNGSFEFGSLLLAAGDTLKLIVENKNGIASGDFNGNIQGKLLDA